MLRPREVDETEREKERESYSNHISLQVKKYSKIGSSSSISSSSFSPSLLFFFIPISHFFDHLLLFLLSLPPTSLASISSPPSSSSLPLQCSPFFLFLSLSSTLFVFLSTNALLCVVGRCVRGLEGTAMSNISATSAPEMVSGALTTNSWQPKLKKC